MIDSYILVKSSYLTRFIRYVMSLLKTTEANMEYKMLSSQHKTNKANFKKQQSAFNEIIKYIQTSISSENATFILKVVTFIRSSNWFDTKINFYQFDTKISYRAALLQTM